MLQIGKRYRCETCGTEVLVTKPSNGELQCCDVAMEQVQPKTVASSD